MLKVLFHRQAWTAPSNAQLPSVYCNILQEHTSDKRSTAAHTLQLIVLVAGHAGSAELRQTAMEGWRARLAAASVLRALPAWRSRGSSGGTTGSMTAASLPAGWRQEAAEQLSELAAAGIEVEVDRYNLHICRRLTPSRQSAAA